MASKGKKGQGKQLKQKPPPLRGNHTVRDCMTWHYPKGYDASEGQGTQAPKAHYLPSKGGIGRPKSRGYDMDNQGDQVNRPPPDDGTVIEALRGWPGYRRSDQDLDDGNQLPPIDLQQGGGDKPGDPWMTDLISHRFMNDAIRRRQMEEEEEMNKLATARAKKSGPGKADIKGNRTSQLRSIALAQKVEVGPHDLWQMPKFKNNAKPHLTTTQTKQKAQGGRAASGRMSASGRAGSGRPGSGRGDPCVCDNNNDTFDYKAYLAENGYDYNYDDNNRYEPTQTEQIAV